MQTDLAAVTGNSKLQHNVREDAQACSECCPCGPKVTLGPCSLALEAVCCVKVRLGNAAEHSNPCHIASPAPILDKTPARPPPTQSIFPTDQLAGQTEGCLLAYVLSEELARYAIQQAQRAIQASSQDAVIVMRQSNGGDRVVQVICVEAASPCIEPPDCSIHTAGDHLCTAQPSSGLS